MLAFQANADSFIAPPAISFTNTTPYTYNGSNIGTSPGYTQNSCFGTGVTITYVVISSTLSYSGFGPPIYAGSYRMEVRIDGGPCNAQIFSTSFIINKCFYFITTT